MLDDFAVVVKTEYVDSGIVPIARPRLVAVENDIVAFGDDALERDVLARVFARHSFEVIDEGLFSVADVRVVLDVDVAGVALDGFAGAAVIEHERIEALRVLLVLF